MTTPLLERVARALCRVADDEPDTPVMVKPGARTVKQWTLYIPEARASIAVQRELIQQLRDAAMHGHAYMGACPDAVNDWTARDPQCPACQAIAAADAALREQ
jgi:hypothetical protein